MMDLILLGCGCQKQLALQPFDPTAFAWMTVLYLDIELTVRVKSPNCSLANASVTNLKLKCMILAIHHFPHPFNVICGQKLHNMTKSYK